MKSIAVYCGSSKGNDPIFIKKSRDLGRLIVKKGITLVYGAGSVGLMGEIADECLDHGGEVTGIIPQFLMDWEVGHTGITNLEVTKDMHSRKSRMVELSDGFIAMPGGFGTLDELFEVLTWGQLDLHKKPIGIYNVNGYFDGIIAFMGNAVKHGFVKPKYVERIIISDDPEELLQLMSKYESEPEKSGKWV